jgi:hypothetical protein
MRLYAKALECSALQGETYPNGMTATYSRDQTGNVYSIDPAGRVRKTVSKGTNSGTSINHYAGPGESLSWKEEEGGKYTRLIRVRCRGPVGRNDRNARGQRLCCTIVWV